MKCRVCNTELKPERGSDSVDRTEVYDRRTPPVASKAFSVLGVKRVRFALGQTVATPGALKALERAHQSPHDFLIRHVTGDWGELNKQD